MTIGTLRSPRKMVKKSIAETMHSRMPMINTVFRIFIAHWWMILVVIDFCGLWVWYDMILQGGKKTESHR